MFSSKSFVDKYNWASVYKPRLDYGRKIMNENPKATNAVAPTNIFKT